MKNYVHVVILGILVASGFYYTEQPVGMFDKEFELKGEVHDALFGLLEDGLFERNGLTIDASGVQSVSVSDGKASFDPPIKVDWKFLSTTVTDVTAEIGDNTIFIDVDRSPVDVRIRRDDSQE